MTEQPKQKAQPSLQETFEQRFDRLKDELEDSQKTIDDVCKKYWEWIKKQDIIFLDKVLGTKFLKFVLLLSPTSDVIKESNSYHKEVQIKSIENLVREMRALELEKSAKSLKQVSLSMKELKEFQIKLLTDDTQDEIAFLKSEIMEVVDLPKPYSTSEIIWWTSLEQKVLEKNSKDKEKTKEFFDWLDDLWLNIVNNNIEETNLDSTVKKNMAVGLNFVFMQLISWLDDNEKSKVIDKLSWLQKKPIEIKWFLDYIQGMAVWDNKVINKIESLLSIVNDYANTKKTQNLWQWWMRNKTLVNSAEFGKLAVSYIKWSTDEHVKQMLAKWEKDDFKDVKMSLDDHKLLRWVAENFWKWKEMAIVEWMNNLKSQGKNVLMENWDSIMKLKSFFESMWIAEFVMKILDAICKFLWYKNWFKDFEQDYVFNRLWLSVQQKLQLKSLHEEYLVQDSEDDESNDSKELKNSIKESMKISQTDKSKTKEISVVDWLNISKFKKTLEKSSIEWVDWKRHSKYFIPNGLIVMQAQEMKLDIFGSEWKVNMDKLNNIQLDEAQELRIINWFIHNCSVDSISNPKIFEKINDSSDLAYLLYANYMKNDLSWKDNEQFLYYKNFILDKKQLTKWEYVPAWALATSKFQEYFTWGNLKLGQLTFDQSKSLLNKIFWAWPWTQLAEKLSQWQSVFITRLIALARHEWWLNFGRTNQDPNPTQQNIWTFQISAPAENGKTARQSVEQKYADTLNAGIKMCESNWIQVDRNSLDAAQKDLLSWLWYINIQRWWESTFAKLRDTNLSDSELINLMSTTIQWGIAAIWNSVVNQMKNLSVNESLLA